MIWTNTTHQSTSGSKRSVLSLVVGQRGLHAPRAPPAPSPLDAKCTAWKKTWCNATTNATDAQVDPRAPGTLAAPPARDDLLSPNAPHSPYTKTEIHDNHISEKSFLHKLNVGLRSQRHCGTLQLTVGKCKVYLSVAPIY